MEEMYGINRMTYPLKDVDDLCNFHQPGVSNMKKKTRSAEEDNIRQAREHSGVKKL
jgi:hypothetical protein